MSPRPPSIRKVTPILIVDEIEPALALWTGALGYDKQIEVPHDGRAGFVLLSRDGQEVMMQTRASLLADVPGIAKLGVGCVLYVDVDSLRDAISRDEGARGRRSRARDSLWSARDFVRDPVGNVVGFAEHMKR